MYTGFLREDDNDRSAISIEAYCSTCYSLYVEKCLLMLFLYLDSTFKTRWSIRRWSG